MSLLWWWLLYWASSNSMAFAVPGLLLCERLAITHLAAQTVSPTKLTFQNLSNNPSQSHRQFVQFLSPTPKTPNTPSNLGGVQMASLQKERYLRWRWRWRSGGIVPRQHLPGEILAVVHNHVVSCLHPLHAVQQLPYCPAPALGFPPPG